MKSLTFSTLLILLLLILGVIFRLYNINFDNLWIDEISSFWISNPDFDFKESYLNHKSLEQTPYLFNLIIKIFFTVFGYDINLARIVPCIFSIFGILSVAYLSKLLSKKNAYIFSTFLISFNIFLINYSQELRVYSTLFFFINISLIFFYYIISLFITSSLIFSFFEKYFLYLRPNYSQWLYKKGVIVDPKLCIKMGQ